MEGYQSTPILECKSCERYGTQEYLALYGCFCGDRVCVNQTTRWRCTLCNDKEFASIIGMVNHATDKHGWVHEELFQCSLCPDRTPRTHYSLHALMDHAVLTHFSTFMCKICVKSEGVFLKEHEAITHLTFEHGVNKIYHTFIDKCLLRIDFVHYLQRFSLDPHCELNKFCVKVT
ncbi:hypothetical protein WDU94_010248 [Cyamophila willieti]